NGRRIEHGQGRSCHRSGVVIVFYSVHATLPGQDPKRTNLSSGKPMAHQSTRMSLAGTNLPNELPLRVHHSHMRSRCAVTRTSVDLQGSWSQLTSNFWRCPLSMNRPFVLVLVRELVLDRPTWFRGRGRERERERLGSWSQCAMLESWRLSMNRPFVLLLVLVIDSSSWLRGRGRERLGSWSQCAMLESWRLSMNRVPSGGFGLKNHVVLACELLEQALF